MAEENKDKKQTVAGNAEDTSKIDVNKQEKLKNKVSAEDKDDQLKHMGPEELRSKLSNKNSDYVYRLQKEIESQGHLSASDAKAKVDALLVEIIIAQHRGQPANGLYMQSPKLKAADMLSPKKKKLGDIPFWQVVVDSALLYIAIFVGLYGIIGLFQNGKQTYNSQMGILTLISVGALMGVFMTKYNDWIAPAASGKKGKTPWAKLILGMFGILAVLFVWIWVLSLPGLRVINPVLPGIVNLVIAVVAYGIRWLFRRYHHIVGSTFNANPRRK